MDERFRLLQWLGSSFIEGNSNFLLNPLTRECKKLPESPFDDSFSPLGSYILLPGLGYESYTDDYKVVMLYNDRFKSYLHYDFHGDASITYVLSIH